MSLSTTDPLLSALMAEGQVTSQGDFSLDMLKARDKLRQFQLLSPHLYGLELIGAAMNGGCSSIDIQTSFGAISYILHDVKPYSKTELAHLYSNLFLPQEDSSLDRLRQLAIGLNSSLALNPRLVTVHSQSARGHVLMELTPEDEGLTKSDQTDGTTVTNITVRHAVGWQMFKRLVPGFDEEIAFVHGRCRHASIPIRINQSTINKPPELQPALAQVHCNRYGVDATLAIASSLPVGLKPYIEEKDRYGPLVWITGVPNGTPLDIPRIVFMVSGVMLTDKSVSLYPSLPIKVLCSAPNLVKNASQSDIVDNARYQQVVEILRDMVPDLMEAVEQSIKTIDRVLGDPHAWPAEGAANYRKYLKIEQDLARTYLERWKANPQTPRPKAELAVPVVEVPEPSTRMTLEEKKRWLAYQQFGSPLGTGWMGLPADAPDDPFTVTQRERPVPKLLHRLFIPKRLCGRFDLEVDVRETAADLDAQARNVRDVKLFVRDMIEQLLTEMTADYSTFSPPGQEQARMDLLDFIFKDTMTAREYLNVKPMTLLGRMVRMPLFPATDGTFLSFCDLLDLYQKKSVVHYTSLKLSGRSLDPGRRVLCISDAERERIKALVPQSAFKEYSQELEQEERARQLQRERGQTTPTLDANRVLAHSQWVQDGLDICLTLARPFQADGTLSYYKHGVLICDRTWRGMPCSGWISGNSLQVDDNWSTAMLPDRIIEAIDRQLEELYANIALALGSIEPVHPDYRSCCQYVCQHLLHHRKALIGLGGLPPSVGTALQSAIFPSRHGRPVSLAAVLERYRKREEQVHVASGPDLEMMVPDGVVILHPERPWVRPFLEAFFGSDRIVDWTLSQSPAAAPVAAPTAASGLLEDTLSALFAQVGLSVHVTMSRSFLSRELGVWSQDDLLLVNGLHPLVVDVDKRRFKDSGVVLHLLLALLAERDRGGDQETGVQIQAVSGLLRSLTTKR